MAWAVFLVNDLALAMRVTRLVRGARLDENGLLYVPDRPAARRPPVSSRQDAETLNEHWLDCVLSEYGAGEQLRRALLARRRGGDVAGSDNTPETEHDDDDTVSPALAAASDDTPLEIETEEDDDDLYHHLGEADEASWGYTPYSVDFEMYEESAGEERSSNRSECVICLVEYKKGDELTMVLCPGAHTFHRACLAVWLKQNLSCPLCRFDLSN